MPAIPSEEEWLEQTARAREEAEQLQATEQWPSDAPVHPIAQLQGPFEESIAESTDVTHDDWQVYLDAETRRDHILTAPKYERLCGRRWKQRPGEKYHPMWKLVAQLSFGLHLLAKGLAKSDAAVIKILQGHVADLDGFIENTTEDILLALNDIEERLDHLRLPLENLPVFNDMLTDRTFRQTVILDHGRINHIIHRTAVALDDSIKDIGKGTQSVRILGFYLKEVRAECNGQSYGLDAVYDAMIGNVDGWKREFKRLKRKAYNLAISLGTLNQVALEIQQLAEAATVNSMRNMASTRPPSRGHRHGKHTLLTPDTHTLAAIPHRPPPQSLTEPVSYTAEARAVSIVSGHSPVTVVNTASSRQESPALQRDGTPPKQALHEKHPSRTGKESSSHANRYYTNAQPNLAKLPRRSVTAPELKINNNNKYGGNEQGSKKRSNTSSSKAADHYVVPEKGSTKTSAKLGSKLDRFQRTTSKILGISALTNVKGTIRKQTKPKVSQRVTIPPKERSWVDPNSHDQQMSWSQVSKDLSDINTFAAKKSTAPELPHLLYKSFLDQTLSDEEEDTEDSPKKELDDEHDPESQITALPVMKDSAAASYNDDGVAAEVASTYSVRNRRFRTKNIHVTPLSKPKFNNSFELGANNGHVIHQDRQTARQKPSVFSFMSSKKGQETAPNPPVVRSRQGSVTSENQRRRPMTSPSASTSAHLYGDIQPPPTFNPTWHTHKRSPLANTETPPISPTTSSNPMASSSSPKTSEIKAPQISQPESHKSIPNTNPRKVPTEKPPTLDINQKEIKKSDTLRGNENNKLRNDASSSTTTTTTTTQKPQHGGLRLFPRTPTTPNVRKFVSTSSLREFSAAESTSDSAHLPRSRG